MVPISLEVLLERRFLSYFTNSSHFNLDWNTEARFFFVKASKTCCNLNKSWNRRKLLELLVHFYGSIFRLSILIKLFCFARALSKTILLYCCFASEDQSAKSQRIELLQSFLAFFERLSLAGSLELLRRSTNYDLGMMLEVCTNDTDRVTLSIGH